MGNFRNTAPVPVPAEQISLHWQHTWEMVSAEVVPIPRDDFRDAITILRHDIAVREAWEDDGDDGAMYSGWHDITPTAHALHYLLHAYEHYQLNPTKANPPAGTIPVPFSHLTDVTHALSEKLVSYDNGIVPEEGLFRRIAHETGVMGRIATAMDAYERTAMRDDDDDGATDHGDAAPLEAKGAPTRA